MTIFKDYFNDYLYSAEEKLHALKSENALLVPGTLWVEHRNGKLLHYHVTNTDSGKKRHLITRDKELLSLLARKIYIEKEIEVLNGNIKLISKAKADIEKHFMSEDVNSILSYISNSNQRPKRPSLLQAQLPTSYTNPFSHHSDKRQLWQRILCGFRQCLPQHTY